MCFGCGSVRRPSTCLLCALCVRTSIFEGGVGRSFPSRPRFERQTKMTACNTSIHTRSMHTHQVGGTCADVCQYMCTYVLMRVRVVHLSIHMCVYTCFYVALILVRPPSCRHRWRPTAAHSSSWSGPLADIQLRCPKASEIRMMSARQTVNKPDGSIIYHRVKW